MSPTDSHQVKEVRINIVTRLHRRGDLSLFPCERACLGCWEVGGGFCADNKKKKKSNPERLVSHVAGGLPELRFSSVDGREAARPRLRFVSTRSVKINTVAAMEVE